MVMEQSPDPRLCSLSWCAGDCKPSEVKAFIADYLEKAVEPCDWLALWSTDVFDVLVEVSWCFSQSVWFHIVTLLNKPALQPSAVASL